MTRVTDEGVATAVERFFKRPVIADSMELLSRRLPAESQILIAGGAIRNIVIEMVHGSAPPTKDIDLFIGGIAHNFSLAEMLKDQTTHRTDLGGLRWQPDSSAYVYDLCLLPNFIIIHTYRFEPTLKNLLTGIDLSINAIIYDYRGRTLYEKECLAAIRDRIIDFNCRLIPDKCLIAYRLLLMAHKTGFRFSEAAFQFLNRQMDVDTLVHLKRLLRMKQGKPLAKTIMCDFDRSCKYSTYTDYLKGTESKGGCP